MMKKLCKCTLGNYFYALPFLRGKHPFFKGEHFIFTGRHSFHRKDTIFNSFANLFLGRGLWRETSPPKSSWRLGRCSSGLWTWKHRHSTPHSTGPFNHASPGFTKLYCQFIPAHYYVPTYMGWFSCSMAKERLNNIVWSTVLLLQQIICPASDRVDIGQTFFVFLYFQTLVNQIKLCICSLGEFCMRFLLMKTFETR